MEAERRSFQAAGVVRAALDEVQWLLDQDRPDLAVAFLKEKLTEVPDHDTLIARLAEIEEMLPRWEKRRFIQGALSRVAELEQLQQWQVAVTVLEEALESCPESDELQGAAERFRDRVRQQDRQKKLARRLEMISQKIAARAWAQALTLIQAAQAEFPGAPELQPLLEEVRTGRRRSECENIVTEVRQCLADGDTEQAELILQTGLESFEDEPALDALLEEIESGKKYREELRTAQLLFGRRQLQEAERILIQLAAQDRPEARVLLDTVREARAAREEEHFYERGREKALRLMQQHQYVQAADLLRNLLSLFPGDPILERDLAAAQSGLDQEGSPAAAPLGDADAAEVAASAPISVRPAVSMLAAQPAAQFSEVDRAAPASRVRRAAMAGAASLLLVSASAAAWKFSRSAAPASRPVPAQVGKQLPAAIDAQPSVTAPAAAAPQRPAPQPASTGQPTAPTRSDKNKPTPEVPAATPLRPFTPPPLANSARAQTQASLLPLPQQNVAIISEPQTASLPAGLLKPVNAPEPPAPAPQKTSPPPVAAPAPLRPGGQLRDAQLISRILPTMPELARLRGISGVVKLEATIDESGAVKNVKVQSGDAILAMAAKNAVLKWKYKPATLNDKPIEVKTMISMVFGGRN